MFFKNIDKPFTLKQLDNYKKNDCFQSLRTHLLIEEEYYTNEKFYCRAHMERYDT